MTFPGPNTESGKNSKDLMSSSVKTGDSLVTPLEPLKPSCSHESGMSDWSTPWRRTGGGREGP